MNEIKDKAATLYRKMSLREKLLIFAFVFVMLVLWANSWLNRLSEWNRERTSVQSDLTVQQQWIDNAEITSQGLAIALERVDPSRTYAAPQLSGRVDSLIRKVGLSTSADINAVRTREGEIFNDHNLRVELKRITIAQFISLNKLIAQDTPYINIQSVQISKNRRQPENLDIRYDLNSFDLKDPNLQ